MVQVQRKDVLCFQHELDRLDIAMLQEELRLLLDLPYAHVLNIPDSLLHLAVDFDEVREWYTREWLHLEPLTLLQICLLLA